MEEELKQIKELALENKKAIENNTKRIDDNFENIQNNTTAVDILKEYKDEIKSLHNEKERQHDIIKRLIRVLVVFGILWAVTVGYLVYVLNDIGVEETTESYEITQDIDDVSTINGNIINRGK